MIRKLIIALPFLLMTVNGHSQQTIKNIQDTASRKGNHQVKTVPGKVVKLDNPAKYNNQPIPPMKSRQDTLMFLIRQSKQQKNNVK